MSLFLRIFQHLLPSGEAWRLTIEKTLRKFFAGLTGLPESFRTYADLVLLDAFPSTTRELPEWEAQFGLTGAGAEGTRRLALDAAWKSQGGQSISYIQGVLQAAGFPVYLHDWWSAHDPFVGGATARDPRDYTEQPLVGEYQCVGDGDLPNQSQCSVLSEDFDQPQCNGFLANDPGYLVNDLLNHEAPPPVPDDPATWPFFIYVGGAVFGDTVDLTVSQRAEFERLLLKLCPMHDWIVLFINYTADGVFSPEFSEEFA